MTFTTSAQSIINWLVNIERTVADKDPIQKRVAERVHSPNFETGAGTPNAIWRPDCNIETAYAMLKAWQSTEDESYLIRSREYANWVISTQFEDGSFPFTVSPDGSKSSTKWVNDNSEVAIFFFRMAEIDTDRAEIYRGIAIATTDYLLTKQIQTGAFPLISAPKHSAMFTAHAVSALSYSYRFVSNKQVYKAAIEKAIDWIIASNIMAGGRIKTTHELASGEEVWRPPSSDQSLVVRALAHAEYFVVDSTKSNFWRSYRNVFLRWLTPLIHENGAMRNGYGDNITHADIYHITDHVYTTAFAIEAYLYSYLNGGNQEHLDNALLIASFASDNLYFSNNPNTNGVLRGAYDLIDNNWDTSEVQQNHAVEGGGEMIYSGWTNAPIAALLYELSDLESLPEIRVGPEPTNEDTGLRVFFNGEKIAIPISQALSSLRVYLNDSVRYIPLVHVDDEKASVIRLYVKGEVKAIARL